MEEAFAQAMQSVGPVGTLVLAFFANEYRKGKAAPPATAVESEVVKEIRGMRLEAKLYHGKQHGRHKELVTLLGQEREDHGRILKVMESLKDTAA